MKLRIETAIFLLALVVRLVYLAGCGSENRLCDEIWDDRIYYDIGTNIAAGNGLSLSFPIFAANAGPTALEPPVYPLMIATSIRVFGDTYIPIRVLQAVLSALTCVLIYKLGHRLFVPKVGLVAGIIMCFYLPLILYTRPILSETTFIFALVLAVWITCRLTDQPSIINSIIAGLAWAFCYLTRTEAMVLAAAVGVYTLGILWTRYRVRLISHLPACLPGALVFLLLIGLWVARNYSVFRAFIPASTTFGMTLWDLNYARYHRELDPNRYPEGVLPELIDVPNFESLTEVERDNALTELGMQFIRERPLTFFRYAASRLLVAYPLIPRSGEFQPPGADRLNADPTSLVEFPVYNTPAERLRVWMFRILVICAVLGAIWALRRRDYAVMLLILLIAANVLRSALIMGHERGRIAIDPFIIQLSAYFLVSLFYAMRHSTMMEVNKLPADSDSTSTGS